MCKGKTTNSVAVVRKEQYLEILTLLAMGKFKELHDRAHDCDSLRVAANELAAEGFLECFIPEIRPGYFLGTWRLTYLGYMELARLEREQKELKARKWRWIAPALTFAAGVIFSTIVSILLPRLTNTLLDRWLSPEVHQVEAVNLPADGVDALGK